MNWIITGGCGFIGTSLIRYLIEAGEHKIRVIDDFSVGTSDDLKRISEYRLVTTDTISKFKNQVEVLQGDIKDTKLAIRITEGAHVIVHLAASTGVQPSIQNPMLDCQENVIGTLNYLEGARQNKVGRFVFASSGGTVVGDCEPPIHENMVPKPKSPYGASKSAGEGYLSAYNGTFGIDTVALRFGNAYGWGCNHKHSVVAKFIRRAIQGQVLEVYGDGTQTRDFIYIDDLIQAIIKAATVKGVGGEVFQIATAKETTVNEIAEMIVPILENAGIKDVKVKHGAPLKGEIRRNFSDTSKAQKFLGWQSEVKLKEGIEKTVNWYIKHELPI